MDPFQSNPFTVLSLIAAPAVLTNASSVLALGTSNRLARAVDRARGLVKELDSMVLDSGQPNSSVPGNNPLTLLQIRQMQRTEKRALLLLKALGAFYLSLGCFAATSLISVLGASLESVVAHWISVSILSIALSAGSVGVSGLVFGGLVLLRETRLAVLNVSEEAALVRERFKSYLPAAEAGSKG